MGSKKPVKLPTISSDHKEALAELAAQKSFSAFEKLCRIEENNIIIQSFAVNSGDPGLAIRKSWHEGRIFELRKIIKTFQSAKKGRNE